MNYIIGKYYSVSGWPKRLTGMNTFQNPPCPEFGIGNWYHPRRIKAKPLTENGLRRFFRKVIRINNDSSIQIYLKTLEHDDYLHQLFEEEYKAQ